MAVYPRVCGEAAVVVRSRVSVVGLSPRVRGSPFVASGADSARRSIPACAGKPWPVCRPRCARRVYPRVCGEAELYDVFRNLELGLSPRVRGSRHGLQHVSAGQGSIPACAGKPPGIGESTGSLKVYPRVCGEAAESVRVCGVDCGLSPRVRGSLGELVGCLDGLWSIPACAGKPLHAYILTYRARVYPRVCGEASVHLLSDSPFPGLSPRVRGSRPTIATRLVDAWSIPACAGKPTRGHPSRWKGRVYPRVCGEASVAGMLRSVEPGLSPRVRGSLIVDGPEAGTVRSIPACAGKPSARTCWATCDGVYPRVCGEASPWAPRGSATTGLSPRVRGSRSNPR